MQSQEEFLQDLKKEVDPYTYAIIAYFAEHGKAVDKPTEMPQAEHAGAREILSAILSWTATRQMEAIREVEKAGGTEFQQTMTCIFVLSQMLPILQRAMDDL